MAAPKVKRDSAKRKEDADLDVFIRFFDTFARNVEGVRKPLAELQSQLESLDERVFHGLNVTEDLVITQGINQGATRGGIYGLADLIYNPNTQEYYGITKESELLRFTWAGNTLPAPKPPPKPFFRMVHVRQASLYICWVPQKTGFFFMKEDWTLMLDTVAIVPISDIIYGGKKSDETFEFYIVSGASLNRYSYTFANNLVSLQDALTLSDIEADSGVIDLTCVDDPKDDRKQWIYCVSGANCTIVDVTGRVHGTKKNLHATKISAIVVTAGTDFVVTVKLWGPRWAYLGEIQAHSRRVTHIIEHPDPSIRASVSFGKDQKLYVFSFDTMQCVETLQLPEIATKVVVNKERQGFVTLGPRKIVMWRMNSVVWPRLTVTSPVVRLLVSGETSLPRQVVAACGDNAVHIVNSANGETVTTALILPTEPVLKSLAYRRQPKGDTLYALVEEHSVFNLQHFDCRTNPAQLKDTWEETKWNVGITCVAFYEFNPRLTIQEKELAFTKRRKAKKVPKTFLLCGRRDGCLVVVDLETGDMTNVTQGHIGSVTFIEIDPELNHAISLGALPSIRLWKVAQSDEAILEPLMDITWKHYPIAIATIVRNFIAFVQNHKESNQHKVVIFNTLMAQKFDHDPQNAHELDIVSISGAHELLIFCSASLDGTVAIRGAKNELYRVVVLNAIPTCAAFCTAQGDILLGIASGIYVLPGDNYLTSLLRNRAVVNGFKAGEPESRIPSSVRVSRDSRFPPEDPVGHDLTPFPTVGQVVAEFDSQPARDLEQTRLRNEDIQKIVVGQHPLDQIVPDFHSMTKQQWDDFGKSVYGDDGENRKFFASESRMEAMLKLQQLTGNTDDFGSIL